MNENSNQSSLRSNRAENATPPRPRERETEQNVSRHSGPKVGPMTTTSTSPIPQRSTRTNENAGQPSTPTRTSDKLSSTSKQEERQTRGNTEQNPWDRAVRRSS